MKTNQLLMSAGVLAALTAALHTLSGTPQMQQPLLQSDIPEPVSLLLYACWHLVTVTLVLSACALIRSARGNRAATDGGLVRFVSLQWLLFGIVFIAVALLFSGPAMLLALPQWVLLLPVGALGLLGSRSATP